MSDVSVPEATINMSPVKDRAISPEGLKSMQVGRELMNLSKDPNGNTPAREIFANLKPVVEIPLLSGHTRGAGAEVVQNEFTLGASDGGATSVIFTEAGTFVVSDRDSSHAYSSRDTASAWLDAEPEKIVQILSGLEADKTFEFPDPAKDNRELLTSPSLSDVIRVDTDRVGDPDNKLTQKMAEALVAYSNGYSKGPVQEVIDKMGRDVFDGAVREMRSKVYDVLIKSREKTS